MVSVVSGALLAGTPARCLVAIDVLGTVHLFVPSVSATDSSILKLQACRQLLGNLQHARVADVCGESSQRGTWHVLEKPIQACQQRSLALAAIVG